MNSIQKSEYESLKFLKNFLEENNIDYFLYAGTLLGSVRHKGFIPWDDDIDIAMTRENFEIFEDLFLEADYSNHGYLYQTRRVFKYQAMCFSKLRNKDLQIKEALSTTQKGNVGSWLDIFPLDIIPVEEKKQKQIFKKLNRYNRILKYTLLLQVYEDNTGIKGKIKSMIQKTNEKYHHLYFFLPYVFKKRKQLMISTPKSSETIYADLSYMYYKDFDEFKKGFMKNEWVEDLIDGYFEGETFKIPRDFNSSLKRMYGDYMTLPKEEDRKTHNIQEY